MGGSGLVRITPENWKDEVLDSPVPVLVDFWAEWCVPCQTLAPVLESLAGEANGRLKIAEVNIGQHRELAQQYNIRSVPTLLLFRDGQVRAHVVSGVVSKQALQDRLAAYLSP